MARIESILSSVKDDLEQVEKSLFSSLAEHVELVRAVGGHVLSSGGKRFRPLLLLLAARLCDYRGTGPTLGRATYEPGWKWSVHNATSAGTSLCHAPHTGIVLSGHGIVEYEDGTRLDLLPGTVFHITSSPHDSWVAGDVPYVSLHILRHDDPPEDPQRKAQLAGQKMRP